ncbi:hypothetical protein U0F29_32660, partial [Bacillus thuringiensis]|nr:hypothetical protein [Bacillus thuringiensis]
EKILKAIDTNKKIGEVTLSDGSVIPLPKITINKLFEIAAFIWGMATKSEIWVRMQIYSNFKKVCEEVFIRHIPFY